MRYQRFASSLTLSCVVLAFSLAACTSTSPGEGGSASVEADVTLAFPPSGPEQSINQACGTIVCTGIDPILGVPRPSADNPEEFCIDLSTTEGPEPKNPVGLLAKRGLSAPGDCTISLAAQTTDGTTACEDEVTFPVTVNATSQVSMVLNCITDPQYGGVDVDGEFNQCPVYRQILVTPTLQSNGNDFTVRTEVYDADNDNANVIVESTCGGAITPAQQVRESCEDVDGANCDAALTAVTCGTAGDCTITVTVAATLADEVDGCDGFLPNGMSNDAARQVIDVACQAQADCGNGVIDLGEQCDPPSDPDDNANIDGAWCDSNCQIVDACDPTDRFCPTPAEGGFDADCASTTCSVPATPVEGETPMCGYDFATEGTACGSVGEECDGAGICRVPPACTPGATECAVVACNTASCPAGVCVYTPDTTQNDDLCDGNTGSCQDGDCVAFVCGNGIVEGTEQCDGDGAGTGGETATCNSNCTNSSCGDGILNVTAGEECEPPGTATCDALCQDIVVVVPACGDGILQGPSTSPVYAGENCDDGNTDPIAPANPGGAFCAADGDCPEAARGQTCNFSTDPGGSACGDAGGSACTSNDDCPVEGQVCDTAQIGTAGTCIAWGDTAAGPCPLNDLGQACTITGVCLPRNPACNPIDGDTCAADCVAQGQIMPVTCRNSFTQTISEIPFFNTIDPNGVITAGGTINADIAGSGAVDAGFLQAAAIALFSDGSAASQLTTATVILARDTITAESGTTAGANVTFDKQNVPDTLNIPFVVNPAPGGETCNTDADCPAAVFSQTCIGAPGGTCEACDINTCAIIVTGGLDVPISTDADGNLVTVPGTWTADTAANGPVVFNTNGAVPGPGALSPFAVPGAEDSWLTVAAGPAGVQLACTGGVVNDSGTGCPAGDNFTNPDCADDVIDPALDGTLIEFPIW